MRRFAEAGNAIVRVACEQARGGVEVGLAGFCIVHLEGGPGVEKVGYVVTLDVDPRCRGQGLGRLLMESIEGPVRDGGGRAMTLHVAVANEAAIRLYERLGYLRAGVEKRFYAEGGDAFLYRKPL